MNLYAQTVKISFFNGCVLNAVREFLVTIVNMAFFCKTLFPLRRDNEIVFQ